jgi:hypothetical protein
MLRSNPTAADVEISPRRLFATKSYIGLEKIKKNPIFVQA